MIKERFLELFEERNHPWARFIQSATDDELSKIGWAVVYICPRKFGDQMLNYFRKEGNFDFVEDYAKTYNLPERMTSRDKARGSKLVRLLELHPDMTAKDFLNYR